MATPAPEHPQDGSAHCWCCGNSFDETDLTPLGSHPEVGVCTACAHWLWRRARAKADDQGTGLGQVGRRGVATARRAVMRTGAQRWPVVGSLLRRLDRRLP